MYNLNICVLYPELLNIYGDRGNIISLVKRSQWRGISVTVKNVSLGESFDPDQFDIVFLGGGQEHEQMIIKDDIIKKENDINQYIENNKVFLCICGGYQLLGKYYVTSDGKKIELLGALDLWTICSNERMIGNIVFECDFLKSETFDGKVVGFENHSGQTFHGQGVTPLGRVIKGYGNNGEDGFEGALYKNVFCSYSHGSLLPKNPELADYILSTALKEKYADFSGLSSLNNQLEDLARLSVIKRII